MKKETLTLEIENRDDGLQKQLMDSNGKKQNLSQRLILNKKVPEIFE